MSDREIHGIFSERDYARKVIPRRGVANDARQRIMTTNVISVSGLDGGSGA